VSGLRQRTGQLQASKVELERLLAIEAAAIRSRDYRFWLVARSIADYGFVLFDRAGRAQLWNPGAERLTGRAEDAIEGARIDELFPSADPGQEPRIGPAPAEFGSHLEDARWTLRADGSRYWASMMVYRAGEELEGSILALVRDETVRKTSEDELHRAHEQAVALTRTLEQRNRDLEAFAAVASHDLQEPLRKIRQFANLLVQTDEQMRPDSRAITERIRAAAERMQVLINEVLEFSRLDRVRMDAVDLNAVAASAVEDLEQSVRESGGQVRLGTLPATTGDAMQLQRVFQNLLSNALKFKRPGVPPVVEVTGNRLQDGGVVVRVVDNGIGFPPEEAKAIFNMFRRLHSRDEFPGTGVGLSISRKIIELHGGTIGAENRPGGEGSTFWFRLPGRTTEEEADAARDHHPDG
jgi:PAS domain S-box-containing protein